MSLVSDEIERLTGGWEFEGLGSGRVAARLHVDMGVGAGVAGQCIFVT
jgi:hypothetical protein